MYPKVLNQSEVEEWAKNQQSAQNACIYLKIYSKHQFRLPNHLSIDNRPRSLHFKIPDREARCSSWGNEPSSKEMIGTVDTLFCKTLKATSFRHSLGPA
jgi:hypothetical protein